MFRVQSTSTFVWKLVKPSFLLADDSWLSISPEELEALWMKRSGISNGNSTSPDLGQVASGMKSFVDKISGVDGAEFPG